jgi:hypothetical protein
MKKRVLAKQVVVEVVQLLHLSGVVSATFKE